MATTQFDVSQLQSPAGEKLAALGRIVLGRVAGLWRAMQNRRSVKQLLEWDARMLNDIGLTPGDVLSAMSGPVGEDPSYRLSVLSVERRAAIRAAARERLELATNRKVAEFRGRPGERIKVLEL
jgi:uncharacterized protein YjiS (DUF1127 family)